MELYCHRGWMLTLVELGLDKFIDAVNKLYVELNSHCPLKLRKDRLVAVWGEETK